MLIISKESAILKIRAPTRQRNQGLLTDPGNLVLFTKKIAELAYTQKPGFLLLFFMAIFYSDFFR